MRRPLLLAGVLLLSAGCASAKIRGSTNGFTDGSPVVIAPGATVAVVPDSQAANPLFEREVRAKIERALAAAGYRVTPAVDAEYLVFASYGVGAPRQEGTLTAVYRPGTTSTIRDEKGDITATVTSSGSFAQVPTTHTERDRWLIIGVANAADVQKGRPSGAPFPWVWQGETISAGASTDLRYVIDYLIIPTIEWFGRNTHRAVKFSIKESDRRARHVRQGQ